MLPSPKQQDEELKKSARNNPGWQTDTVSSPSTSQSSKYSSDKWQNSIRMGDLYLLRKSDREPVLHPCWGRDSRAASPTCMVTFGRGDGQLFRARASDAPLCGMGLRRKA